MIGIFESMISFENDELPGNDKLTRFLPDLLERFKICFFELLTRIQMIKILCTSQRQAIIKLLEKPSKDKIYVSDW